MHLKTQRVTRLHNQEIQCGIELFLDLEDEESNHLSAQSSDRKVRKIHKIFTTIYSYSRRSMPYGLENAPRTFHMVPKCWRVTYRAWGECYLGWGARARRRAGGSERGRAPTALTPTSPATEWTRCQRPLSPVDRSTSCCRISPERHWYFIIRLLTTSCSSRLREQEIKKW